MLTLLTELEAGSLWNCSCNLLGLLHCGKKDGRGVRSWGGRGPHETEGAPPGSGSWSSANLASKPALPLSSCVASLLPDAPGKRGWDTS